VIVVDCSAMIHALVGTPGSDELWDALAGPLAAPHLLDVEVLSALRGLTLGRRLSPDAAGQAIDHYFDFTLDRFETAPLAGRIWALRHQFTSYDATYLALAEALDVPLVTADAKLLTVGHAAQIRFVTPT